MGLAAKERKGRRDTELDLRYDWSSIHPLVERGVVFKIYLCVPCVLLRLSVAVSRFSQLTSLTTSPCPSRNCRRRARERHSKAEPSARETHGATERRPPPGRAITTLVVRHYLAAIPSRYCTTFSHTRGALGFGRSLAMWCLRYHFDVHASVTSAENREFFDNKHMVSMENAI